MLVTSNIFILYVLVAMLVYYIVADRYQWCVLLAFSMGYYILSGTQFLPYLLFSIVLTYLSGLLIEKNPEKKKFILILGLVLNFGMLGVMKYTNFVIDNINALFHMELKGAELLLPLGISFYVFQTSGYLADVYWGKSRAEKNIFKYTLFVSFFPQILQGPIARYGRLAHQFCQPHRFQQGQLMVSVRRIVWGFFKKMVIADWAAVFVDSIFAREAQVSGIALFGAMFYLLQLYADFSGGMDIVMGIGSLFGIQMDENFRQPFFAASVSEFWRRWHITLSSWFRDYIYIPLGGNRVSSWKWIRNIAVVWLVTGIWHGASWNYVVWGLYFGVLVLMEKLFLGKFLEKHKILAHGYTLFSVLIGFVIFSHQNLAEAGRTILRIFAVPHLELMNPEGMGAVGLGVILLAVVGALKEKGKTELPAWLNWCITMVLLVLIGAIGQNAVVRGFIYAQF